MKVPLIRDLMFPRAEGGLSELGNLVGTTFYQSGQWLDRMGLLRANLREM